MSFKVIKELRQAGKLEEALQMANHALEAEPDNIWNKRAAAWVYYDYLKKYAETDSFDTFKENLNRIKGLGLPEIEKMVFDKCAWQIGSMVFALQKKEFVEYVKINELFEIIKDFHFTKPSEAYSFIYKAFHKGYQNWSEYLEFADWWNFENFRSEDYLKEKFKDNIIMSIAEQAYIAYSKKLLEGEPLDPFGQEKIIDKVKIQSFLPKLDSVIEKHSDYQYPPYFKAKLLLALGSDENILAAFLPFAMQKKNVFWVWELMAEIFDEDKEIQFACYCKALSLKTPEDFVVKTRQAFAAILVDRQMYEAAKTEIEQVAATRKAHNWKLPTQIINWANQDWYKTTSAKKDNKDLYSQHIEYAEEILFKDIPEETIAIEFVNTTKKMASFVKNEKINGFFKYDRHFKSLVIGDVLNVRLKHVNENFYQLLTANKAPDNASCKAIKSFSAPLDIKPGNTFGFADGVFVHPQIITRNQLANMQTITGQAILSFNKSKKEWGWKAFEMTI